MTPANRLLSAACVFHTLNGMPATCKAAVKRKPATFAENDQDDVPSYIRKVFQAPMPFNNTSVDLQRLLVQN